MDDSRKLDDSRTVERTFTVTVPVERAWKAMTDPDEMAQWFFAYSPGDEADGVGGDVDFYGRPARIDVLEVDRHRLLRYAEEGGPVRTVHGRAEVTVTFADAAVDGATRITITRSGFGDGAEWDAAIEQTGRGLDENIADLILWLECGVSFPRHQRQPAFAGLLGFDDRGGLLVHSVEPGSFGERLGLIGGDVLVELGGAAVFGQRELLFFLRSHTVGDVVDAAWVRDGALVRGKVELDGWRPPGR